MIEFPKQECPLCGKLLQYRLVSKIHVYDCPTKVEYRGPNHDVKTHYEVELNDSTAIQHILILPYGIDTDSKLGTSRIYKQKISELYAQGEAYYKCQWSFIQELPRIKEDTEDNLRNRIQRLMTFA